MRFMIQSILALIFVTFFRLSAPVAAEPESHFEVFNSTATRDTLVDVHCPKCEGFESRRLEVLKDSDGAITALRFFKIKSGVVTDTIEPRRFKESLVPMYEQSGFTVMQLDARLVNPEKGGPAVLSWFGNVLTKAGKGSLALEVRQDDQGDWGLTISGKKVTSLIVTPTRFGVDDVVSR
jgi:hypothetical protein